MKHIHILGICGTFMGGLALLAREAGFKVTGSDQNVYPPMSTQLTDSGIELMQGYRADNIKTQPDLVVIGNALSRGNLEVEAVLNSAIPYTSGARWLAENILQDKWVLAVSGTHGKTTTASMLAWILQYANLEPGFLIGGVPEDFGVSAKSSDSVFFVIEADEYDTAFFDKRSKFVHYHPQTLLINNIEFDHADIFADIGQIKTQFHHLVRTVPGEGLIIYPTDDQNIVDTLDMGCWSQLETMGATGLWQTNLLNADGSSFEVIFDGKVLGKINWSFLGEHNVNNAIGAIVAARHSGVSVEHSLAALGKFKGVKRRMQKLDIVNNITVYDDFAHHPTAIKTTLDGLRKNVGSKRIVAVLDLRSNTMKMGLHKDTLLESLSKADLIYIHQPAENKWSLPAIKDGQFVVHKILDSVDELLAAIVKQVQAGDHVVIMSNGGFANIHQRLIDLLYDK